MDLGFILAAVPGFESAQDGGAILMYIITAVLIPALIALVNKYKNKSESKVFKEVLDTTATYLDKVKNVLISDKKKEEEKKKKT